jgi:hypothetical protein
MTRGRPTDHPRPFGFEPDEGPYQLGNGATDPESLAVLAIVNSAAREVIAELTPRPEFICQEFPCRCATEDNPEVCGCESDEDGTCIHCAGALIEDGK